MINTFKNYIQDIQYKDWEFNILMDGERPYLQIGFWEKDAFDESEFPTYQKGRKWMLSPHMTKSEVVQTAFKAILTAEEHEAREKFRYKDKPVFGPHFNIDALVRLCDIETLDIRTKEKVA